MSATTSSMSEQIVETPVVARLREQSFNRAEAYDNHQTSVTDHHAARAALLQREMAQLSGIPATELLKELREKDCCGAWLRRLLGLAMPRYGNGVEASQSSPRTTGGSFF